MSLLQAALLGVVQGLTEFLPISSDGHLVVFSLMLPGALMGRDALGFDVLLHGASLLALVLLYGRVWLRLLRAPFIGDRSGTRFLFLLLLSTLPGAVAGVLLEDIVALQLRTLTAAGLGFLCTALVLILGERIGRRRAHLESDHTSSLTIGRILILGVAQAVAILPGVSRSGLTISAGQLLGFSRRRAVDVSFLMAAPIIAGAVAKILFDGFSGSLIFPPWNIAITGFIATFVVSMLAIVMLRRFVREYSLAWFAWYLVPLSFFLLYHFSAVQSWMEWGFLVDLVRRYGALIVFPVCFIEVIPPLSFVSPGIFLLMIAGSLQLPGGSLLSIMIAAFFGLALGNMLLFKLGYFYGHTLAHFLHLTESRLRRIEHFMLRFGRINVFLGQFVGLIRPGVAFAAGTARMPWSRYYPSMLLSALAWSAFYVGIGYLLGRHAPQSTPFLAIAGMTLYLLGILAVILEVRAARHVAEHRT